MPRPYWIGLSILVVALFAMILTKGSPWDRANITPGELDNIIRSPPR